MKFRSDRIRTCVNLNPNQADNQTIETDRIKLVARVGLAPTLFLCVADLQSAAFATRRHLAIKSWSTGTDSNRRKPPWKGGA